MSGQTDMMKLMANFRNFANPLKKKSGAVAQFVEVTVLQAGSSWVRLPMVSLQFFIDTILPATLWPWNRLSL
jgi:hypothetical protein